MVDEAVEAARSLGDRQGEIMAESFRGTMATRDGNWRLALRSFADSAAKQFDYGETMMLLGPLWWGSFALCRLGDFERTALVLGFSAANLPQVTDVETRGLRTETEQMLRDGMGDDEMVRSMARGAAMPTRDVVALLQEAAAAFDVP